MEDKRDRCGEEFCLVVDQEEKTVVVKAMRPGETVKLTKEGARRLAGLLLGQIRDW